MTEEKKTAASHSFKWALILMAMFIMMIGTTVFGAVKPDKQDPEYVKKLNAGYFDEEISASKLSGSASNKKMSAYTSGSYTHGSIANNRVIVNGIDVSKWDGVINWKKVKAAGIDYAIIRIGYSTLATGSHQKDYTYERNIKGAKAAGIKVGVYYFAQSITVAEAKSEADYVLKLLGNTKLDFPVVFDSEDTYGGRLIRARLSKTRYTEIADAFCKKIADAGYTPMVYSNLNGWTNLYDHSTLSKKYAIWFARYNYATKFSGDYVMWQYSETGHVNGINAKVDMNFYYRPKNATTAYVDEIGGSNTGKSAVASVSTIKAAKSGSKAIKVSFSKVSGAKSYEIYRSDSMDGSFEKIASTKKTSYTDKKVVRGRSYIYRVVTVSKKGKSAPSDEAMANTALAKTAKVKTTMLCYLRKGAGTDYDTVGYAYAGTTCKLISFCKSDEGYDWYRVTATADGKTVTGYVSSRCADRIE